MSQDRYDLTGNSSDVEKVFNDMVRRNTISADSKQLAVKGGAIIPQMMGGPVARRVGATSHRSLYILDNSGSMWNVIDDLIESLKTTKEAMIEVHQETGVRQLMGVMGFNTQPWVIMPYTDVNLIPDDAFDTLNASGATAVYDALGTGILGDAGYGHLLQQEGAMGEESSVYLFTDTEENSSQIFSLSELNRIMDEGRRTRRRRFGAFGFGQDGGMDYLTGRLINRRQHLIDMGFKDRNIIMFVDGFTKATIKQAFFKSSQSVKQVSIAISQGVSTMSNESPGDAADNMMFT